MSDAPKKPHACVSEMNTMLAEHNLRIDTPIAMGPHSLINYIQVTVHKIDRKKRAGPAHLYASFCPFCGIELRVPPLAGKDTNGNPT